jgi:hypothetical protein
LLVDFDVDAELGQPLLELGVEVGNRPTVGVESGMADRRIPRRTDS